MTKLMPPESRLWNVLNGDAYTYRLVPGPTGYRGQGAHFRMCLKETPDDIVAFMTSRIPNLDPSDWWWMPKTDANGTRIEIAIREAKVVEING